MAQDFSRGGYFLTLMDGDCRKVSQFISLKPPYPPIIFLLISPLATLIAILYPKINIKIGLPMLLIILLTANLLYSVLGG